MTPYELEKCRKETLVFVGDDCITKALDYLLIFKGDERKVKNKNVLHNLQLNVQNGSGFDTWIIINNFFLINTLLILLKMEKV